MNKYEEVISEKDKIINELLAKAEVVLRQLVLRDEKIVELEGNVKFHAKRAEDLLAANKEWKGKFDRDRLIITVRDASRKCIDSYQPYDFIDKKTFRKQALHISKPLTEVFTIIADAIREDD